MTHTVRVFVNASPVDVPAGSSAIECVRIWSVEEGKAVDDGRRVITDSRGLRVDVGMRVAAGAIFRTVSNRASEPRGD